MAKQLSDGSIMLDDGEVIYPHSIITTQALLEIINLIKPAAMWPFIGGGGGTPGSIGEDGSQGNQGLPGDDGGPQGNQGNSGLSGFQGSQGFQSNIGAQGFQGSVGPTGSTGVQGNQGSQGVSGPQGNQGNQGVAGAAGAAGVQGNQGNQGVSGPQGNIGNQGNQGLAGLQGAQGVQGPQGNIGNQGLTGLQGLMGIQGFQGGPSPWTDAGTTVHLVTDTDEVTVGPSTAIARLGVIGDTTSQVTAGLRETASQSAQPLENQNSAGAYKSAIHIDGFYEFFNTAGDAQPISRITDSSLGFGPGGVSTIDIFFGRKAASQATIVLAAGGTGSWVPNADNQGTNGTSSLRWSAMVATQYEIFAALGDAQPVIRINDGFGFGPGGAVVIDTFLGRKAASQLDVVSAAGVAGDLVPVADGGGSVGTAALRWGLIRGVTVTPGDLNLVSEERGADWTLREEENGIRAINNKNGKNYYLRLAKV